MKQGNLYCYWSVVDGPYAEMMKTAVHSAREVGVFRDFHIWTDRPIPSATCHDVGELDKSAYLFKLKFLRDHVRKLNYQYFIWLDADTYFVRNPGNILRVLQGAPVHASLECDALSPDNRRPDWWGCSLTQYARLMRAMGVNSRSIFNVNAGFWIVHHDVIETFFELAIHFWEFCDRLGYEFTEEPPLAYAIHMLCGDPYRHTLARHLDLWVSDWIGCYYDSLPDGRSWMFEDYFSGERSLVNPAIVHAMRSKKALIEFAAEELAGG